MKTFRFHDGQGDILELVVKYEVELTGCNYCIALDKKHPERGGYVIKEGEDEFDDNGGSEIVVINSLVKSVFEAATKKFGPLGFEPHDHDGDEVVPTTLYFAPELIENIPVDEKGFSIYVHGRPIHYHVEGGVSYKGQRYAMVHVDADGPGVKAGDVLVFEMGPTALEIVDDPMEGVKARLAYMRAQKAAKECQVEPDENGELPEVIFFEDDQRKTFPFSRIFGMEYQGSYYALFHPEYHIEGEPDNLSFVYKGEPDDDIDHFSLVTNDGIVNLVFEEFQRVRKQGLKTGFFDKKEDDLF